MESISVCPTKYPCGRRRSLIPAAYGRSTPFLPRGQGCRPLKQHTLTKPGSGVGVRAIGEAAEVVEPVRTTTADFSYVSYQLNTWSARFERTGVSVLVDPWLCGELFFESVPWLFNAKKGMIVDGAIDVDAVAAETDVIIITQGLNDHCHRPTLKALDKNIAVVASPTAAQVCRELGFRTVYGLEHGESVTILDGRLRVTGTAGALVGPPWSKRENGFVMEEVAEGGVRMFYECHCDFDEAFMRGVGQVDVVVTSTSSVYLSPTASKPIAYPVVSGNDNLVSLVKLLRPKVLLPLMYENGATQSETGPLAQLTFMEGRLADQPAKLQAAGLGDVRFISDFVPGERMYVSLNDA